MAMSNAERQRKYRERMKEESDTGRINMVVSMTCSTQLARMARHFKVTKRDIIEKLINFSETSHVNGSMSKETEKEYFAPF